jgi:hypothetical protein
VTTYAVDIAHEAISLPTTPFVAGAVWVEVRPNLRRLHTVAGDILAALGKRRDLAGKGRNEHEDVTHAVAWMRAYEVTDLVVLDAQRLHPLILRGLANLADQAQVELWLLHRPPRDDNFLRALTRRDATDQPLHAVPEHLTKTAVPLTAALPLPPVPHTEFVTFRTTCRETLTADALELVETRFLATAQHCDTRLGRDGAHRATVATLAYELINPAPDDPKLITDLRALQVAAWQHDLYVRIDLPRLLHSEERPRFPSLEADFALTAYRQPYRAITAVLTRHGVGLEDIANTRLCDCTEDGRHVRIAGRTVPLGPHTARAVRAQHHLRSRDGADPTDLLLPHSTKALAKALTDAAHDLGLHLHGRRAERTRDHTEGALRALGIDVMSLP